MNTRTTISLILLLATAANAAAREPAIASVYIPHSVTASGTMTIGSICSVRCEDERLLTKIKAIAIDQAPLRKKTKAISRELIHSRLTAAGIREWRVKFSGADTVLVAGNSNAIPAALIIEACTKYLAANKPAGEKRAWKPITNVKDIVLPPKVTPKLIVKIRPSRPTNTVKLHIAAKDGETLLGTTVVTFQLNHTWQLAVAKDDISRGEVMTPDNVGVTTEYRPVSQKGWIAPFGRIATRGIAKGSQISASLLAVSSAKARPRPKVLKRQGVTMLISGRGFHLTARGIAMENGYTGGYIRVRNIDTNKIVTAKVIGDGTVRPIYGGSK